MTTQRVSVTATIMAFYRAVEMLFPEEERVCNDPLAVRFLTPEWAAPLADRNQLMKMAEEAQKTLPGVNGAVVSRVRFMDDRLESALKNDVRQVVILGAGYDSRAYRFGFPENNSEFFEIDHPDTQADKRAKVEAIFGEIPDYVHFVSADFTGEIIEKRLLESGYDPRRKSFFILEGLIPYLPRQNFENLLSVLAGDTNVENEMVFDYLPPDVINGNSPRVEAQSMYSEVKKHGETFRLGFEPRELESFLNENGFMVIEDIPAPDLKPLYFKGNSASRQVTPIFRFVYAKEKK